MKTIVIYNNKGGVGKTTVTYGLASVFGSQGKKVLVIDTDPQGNLTSSFKLRTGVKGMGKCLAECVLNKLHDGKIKTKNYILKTTRQNVDILRGGQEMANCKSEIEKALGLFKLVYKEIVTDIAEQCDYDLVLVDTAPELDAHVTQILMAADYLIIPTTTGRYATDGLEGILKLYDRCRIPNPNLKLAGILLNNVASVSAVGKAIVPMLRESYGDIVFDNVIRKNSAVEKIEWNGLRISSDDESNNAFVKDIIKFNEELVKKIGI